MCAFKERESKTIVPFSSFILEDKKRKKYLFRNMSGVICKIEESVKMAVKDNVKLAEKIKDKFRDREGRGGQQSTTNSKEEKKEIKEEEEKKEKEGGDE